MKQHRGGGEVRQHGSSSNQRTVLKGQKNSHSCCDIHNTYMVQPRHTKLVRAVPWHTDSGFLPGHNGQTASTLTPRHVDGDTCRRRRRMELGAGSRVTSPQV